LTGITVTVALTYPTGQIAARPLPRTYIITPTGGGQYTASLTLRYTDAELSASDVLTESQLRLYHYDKSTHQWTEHSTLIDSVNNILTATLVNGFSAWAIGGPGGEPTAVRSIEWRSSSAVLACAIVWLVGGLYLVFRRRAQ
jgi:hypothetical protein